MSCYNHNLSAIYFGEDIEINSKISIHQPTLKEIALFGEEDYFSLVNLLTATPFDLIAQLDDIGIDFTEISCFDLFCIIASSLSVEKTKILFGDNIDFTRMRVCKNTADGEICLSDPTRKIIINQYTQTLLANAIRQVHGLKKNQFTRVKDEFTRKAMIRNAREKLMIQKMKPQESVLQPLISFCVNAGGLGCDFFSIQQVPIGAFMDSIKRLQIIKSIDNMFSYSGAVDLSKVKTKDLDYLRII